MNNIIFPLTHCNTKLITSDTPTIDILNMYAIQLDTLITTKDIHCRYGYYSWIIQLGNYPPISMRISETRRRAIDGTLFNYIKNQTI